MTLGWWKFVRGWKSSRGESRDWIRIESVCAGQGWEGEKPVGNAGKVLVEGLEWRDGLITEDVLIISTDAGISGWENRSSNLICGLDKFQHTCTRACLVEKFNRTRIHSMIIVPRLVKKEGRRKIWKVIIRRGFTSKWENFKIFF